MLKTLPRPVVAFAAAGALIATGAAAAVPAHAAYPDETNGRIAYSKSVGDDGYRLFVIEPDGTSPTPVTSESLQDFGPSWSPDGTKLAYASRGGLEDDFEIRVHDFAANTDVPLTDTGADEQEPTWSPDGTQLAYGRDGDVWVMDADGTDQHAVTNGSSDEQPAWNPAHPDRIAFTAARNPAEPGERDLYEVNLVDGFVSTLSNNADDESNPNWSPDGSRLVFARELLENQALNWDVHSLVPSSAQQRLTNAAGTDYDPAFSPDGTKIVFRSSRSGVYELWTMGAFGASQAKLSSEMPFTPDWGPGTPPPPPPADGDQDGVPDSTDNCPAVANQNQQNTYGDARGDACEDRPATVVTEEKKEPEVVVTETKPETKAEPPAPRPQVVTVKRCVSRRNFAIHVWRHGIVRVRVVLNGKRIPAVKRGRWTAQVDLRDFPKGRFSVHLTMTRADGKVIREVRRYRTCGGVKRP